MKTDKELLTVKRRKRFPKAGLPITEFEKPKLSDYEIVAWNKKELDKARSPLVYVFVGEKDEVLYVGKSLHGFYRPLTPVHDAGKARDLAVEIYFYFCKDEQKALFLERLLISKHKPKYNKQINMKDPLANTQKMQTRIGE